MKTVLLSYLERNKVFQIPDEKNDTDLTFLEKGFRKTFSYASNVSLTVTFQRYDEAWGEYIELSEDDIIRNKDKLKVVVTPCMITPDTSFRSDDCESSSRASCMPEAGTRNDDYDLQSTSLESSLGLFGSDDESPIHSTQSRKRPVLLSDDEENSDIKPQVKKRSVLKCQEDAIPLPDPFPLPKYYGADVEAALKAKRMTSTARQAFIGKIASAMLCYKRYPTSSDYENVSRSVIKQYPFMKSPAGSPAGAIITSLRNAFKEFRRDKTKKREKVTGFVKTEKAHTPGRNVLLCTPQTPEGEDEVSFSRHTKALQTEFKKTHHNLQIVDELMSSSFALRRKDILEHPCGLKAVLEKYPFLRNPDQLLKEMQRILNEPNWVDSMQHRWDELKPKVVHQAHLELPHKARLRAVLKDVDKAADSTVVALVVLPYMIPDSRCSPDHEKVLYFTEGAMNLESIVQQRGQPQPYVLASGNINNCDQLFLIVDCEIVCEISVNVVPLVLLSVYFVFNICYVRGCNNFYSFLEGIFLKPKIDKFPSSVKHFITTLHHIN